MWDKGLSDFHFFMHMPRKRVSDALSVTPGLGFSVFFAKLLRKLCHFRIFQEVNHAVFIGIYGIF